MSEILNGMALNATEPGPPVEIVPGSLVQEKRMKRAANRHEILIGKSMITWLNRT